MFWFYNTYRTYVCGGAIMKICIKNKKRFITALIGTLITIVIFCFPITAKSCSNSLPQKVVVLKGETLWKIVNQKYPNENLSKKTYEIAEINNIVNGTIYPGQVLLLP